MKYSQCFNLNLRPTVYLPALLLFILFGCTTPNVKPFAESTGTIVTGFKVGSAKGVSALNLADRSDKATSLEQELTVRYELLDALLVFSMELAQIQSDSDISKASVLQISQAANQLAMGLSSGISAPVTALANKLAGEALEIREFYLISKALKKIAPLVKEITDLLAADIQSVRNLYVDSMTDAYNARENQAEKILDEDLENRIQTLQKKIVDGSAAEQEVSIFAAIFPVWQDQQQKIESLINESKSLRLEQKQGQAFYDSVKEAIAAWFNAYKELALAFEEKRQPNFIEIYLKAQEIRTLIDAL